MEQELVTKEALQNICDTLPVGIFILDKQGTIVHINPAAKKIWGGAKDVGPSQFGEYKGWWVSSGKRIEAGQWAAARAIATGAASINEEIEIETFTGERKFILNSALPLKDADGNISGGIIVNEDITERKRSEQECAMHREILERLFSSVDLLIAYMDRDFNFLKVNRAYAEADGKNPDFYAGKNHFELYPDSENENIFRKVIATGEPYYAYSKPFVYAEHPERGVTYWDWSLQPVKEPSGKVSGIILSLVNVTGHKRTEEHLKKAAKDLTESEERLRAILNTMGNAVYMKDLGEKYLFANRSFLKTINAKEEDVIGKTVQEVFPEEMVSTIQEHDSAALKSGTTTEFEEHFTLYDGAHVFLSIRFPLKDREGNPYALCGVSTDITEIKRTEEALIKSEKSLKNAQRLAHIGGCEWDIVNNTLRVSDEVDKIVGLPKDELGDLEDFIGVVHPEDRDVLKKDIENTLYGKMPLSTTYRIIRPDGQERILYTTGEVERDEAGNPLKLGGTAQDITELKRAEAEIRKLNVELEKRVEERTNELRQAFDELAAANREIETFTYSVAHDLRSPLRLIDGFSTILIKKQKDRIDRDGMDSLERIRGAAKRMGALIDDLLNLSQVAKAEINSVDMDLSAVTSLIAIDLKKADPDRTGVFKITEGAYVRGDEKLIRMVIENLLGNAWKYTSRNKDPYIEFGLEKAKDGKNIFYVRDNGIGFDMKYARKIFEPFQRLHSSEEFPGTGVGLATVKRIINRHGGRVWAESEPGKGTTVYFTLERGQR